MNLTQIPMALVKPQTGAIAGQTVSVVSPEKLGTEDPQSGLVPAVIQGTYDSESGTVTLVNADDSIVTITGFPTERSLPQGHRGPEGKVGLRGLPGRSGRDGKPGIQGCPGVKGDRGLRGPIGPEGPRGPQGEIGKTGEKGDKGDKGDAGADGVEPEYLKTSRGVSITIKRSGGNIQSGYYENILQDRTITVLFPRNLVNQVASIILFFKNPSSYQAQNYEIGNYFYDDLEIGGFTITLKGTVPTPLEAWQFWWLVMGD
jgi:hypothetical protein